jgi:hypothetical protein
MGVTVTLIFSDESHREAWLVQEEIIASDMPVMKQDEYVLPEGNTPEERKRVLKRIDYERRRANTDLVYEIGPIEHKCRI